LAHADVHPPHRISDTFCETAGPAAGAGSGQRDCERLRGGKRRNRGGTCPRSGFQAIAERAVLKQQIGAVREKEALSNAIDAMVVRP
jgi:hypothetical protein